MAELSPAKGGCWFCHQDDDENNIVYDVEFDTFVHKRCIKQVLEDDPDHPEAKLMEYLL